MDKRLTEICKEEYLEAIEKRDDISVWKATYIMQYYSKNKYQTLSAYRDYLYFDEVPEKVKEELKW